jgi:hypothetical protein
MDSSAIEAPRRIGLRLSGQQQAILTLSVLALGAALQHAFPVILTKYGPPCFFHEWTHLYCPGCGGTRAAVLLARGDLLGALRMNAFAVLAMGYVGACLLKTALTGKGFGWSVTNGRPGQVLAACILAFFVVRNFPFKPFTYLAPVELSTYDAQR